MFTMLRSAPNGLAMIGWKKLALAVVAVWLLPAAFAALALAVQWLVNTRAMGDAGLTLWLASVLLLASPLLSWFGLVLATPFVSALLNRGWFGWGPALVLGMAVGGAAAVMMNNPIALSFGACLIVLLRAVLGRMQPAAFAEPPDSASPV